FYFFFSSSAAHRDLHSFPTRRSSDLDTGLKSRPLGSHCASMSLRPAVMMRAAYYASSVASSSSRFAALVRWSTPKATSARVDPRSEEHTSELQSRFDLVCRLLLEKKK